ncbi:MAG: DUF1146 domain-containing protein [Bacilli bacterium]|nr:DUF1146 domain-containing protein [Bacilli bacterium]
MVKIILYVLAVPITIWSLDSININQIFKQNRIIQARVFYFLLAISISYLAVNFLYDFFLYTSQY